MAAPEARNIRLVIVDDHALFREGIATLLGKEPDFEIAGKYASASEAFRLLPAANADVILLDFDLGNEPALDFVREVRANELPGRMLVVTAGVSQPEALQLVRAGVSGILHKHNPPETLCTAIRQVANGEVCLEAPYLKPLFQTLDENSASESPVLTDRDKTILRHVFQGLANKEIGAKISLSEGAVKACLRQLFQKLGVNTRAQLVRVALEHYRDQL